MNDLGVDFRREKTHRRRVAGVVVLVLDRWSQFHGTVGELFGRFVGRPQHAVVIDTILVHVAIVPGRKEHRVGVLVVTEPLATARCDLPCLEQFHVVPVERFQLSQAKPKAIQTNRNVILRLCLCFLIITYLLTYRPNTEINENIFTIYILI